MCYLKSVRRHTNGIVYSTTILSRRRRSHIDFPIKLQLECDVIHYDDGSTIAVGTCDTIPYSTCYSILHNESSAACFRRDLHLVTVVRQLDTYFRSSVFTGNHPSPYCATYWSSSPHPLACGCCRGMVQYSSILVFVFSVKHVEVCCPVIVLVGRRRPPRCPHQTTFVGIGHQPLQCWCIPMCRKTRPVSDAHQLVTGPRQGHVEASIVGQKAGVFGPDKGNENNVGFAALTGIDRGNQDRSTKPTRFQTALDQGHLRLVKGDDAKAVGRTPQS